MAVPDSREASDPSLDFLEHSYLTYIIPFETDLNLEQALSSGRDSNKPLFDAIDQREWLFFGMLLTRRHGAQCLTLLIHRPQMRLSTYT